MVARNNHNNTESELYLRFVVIKWYSVVERRILSGTSDTVIEDVAA